MVKGMMLYSGALLLTACYSIDHSDAPALDAYDNALASGATGEKLKAAAWRDVKNASDWCTVKSNNYEIRYKNSEGWRLGLGATGGVFGFTGAMLVAAGTGGVAAGIASGLAGVASTTLGNAKDGPLGTAELMQERDGIVSKTQLSLAAIDVNADALVVHNQAIKMAGYCPSAVDSKK